MTALILACVLSFAVALAFESVPPSLSSMRAPWSVLLFRAGVHIAAYAAAFSVSWRPWHAALVVVAASGLLGAGSAIKRGILGEPLIFTDAALVRHAIRHPRLYYAERLARPPALAALAALLAATVAWFTVEPSILPSDGLFLLALPPAIAIGLAAALLSDPAAVFARSQIADPADPASDVARFGLIATLFLHCTAWRKAERPSPAARALAQTLPAPRSARLGPQVVIAIQCESFVDIAARGLPGPALPALERLRGEAVAFGRVHVPAEGAYTMRSEFGFLTGLPAATLGLDALDPYLTAGAYASQPTLASLFAAAGRATVFLHPYDRRFFDRDILVPKLGFERFVDGGAFEGASRFGPYVADAAVADAVLAEIAAARDTPLFLFAVTIENHGPWGPGRLAETSDPAAQYALHLANADRMIGRIADALRALPGGGALCIYGDHAPGRPLHPGLPDRRSTDYVIWDSRSASGVRPRDREDIDVAELGRALLAMA